MDITSAQANVELSTTRSEEDLRALIRRLDVGADGKITILYSGRAADGVWSTDVIDGLLKAGEDIRVLDKTEAFRFLDVHSQSNPNHELIEALERVFESDPLENGTRANQFLFGTIDEAGKRVPNGAWDIVSAKFASATVGEVRAITSYAQPDRVFGATELPRVLTNERVTTVEGIDRSRLSALQVQHGGNAAFEVVQARSFESTGKLNVAVNYAGDPLRGDVGELQIDGRAYFADSPVAAKLPGFTTVTRPLADRMQSPSEFAKSGWTHLEAFNSIQPMEPAPSEFQEPRRSALDRLVHAADDKATKVMTGKQVIRMGADGLPNDDVPHDLATEEHLRSYERAAMQMREFKVPALWNRNDPHSYMLYGLLDGTGNDVEQDKLHATNVAKLRDEVIALQKAGVRNIGVEYKEGPGTQKNFVENTIDGATGRTSLARAEEMYKRLVENAAEIHKADPHAKISFHLEGFSRGASTVPLLARMIHERGIPDTRSAVERIDEHGNTIRTYTRYLQPPGGTPMSVGLYDPVPTGYLEDYFDRRLPPSVVSGFQVNAAHERRGLFPVDRIIPEGLSQDGRFLSVTVAGVHSDIGNSYLRDGLGNRSINLMTDYRNTLMGEPLFQRVYETTDPRMNVIHHSTEGNMLFRNAPKVDRASPAGEVRQLTPDHSRTMPPGEVVHVPYQTPEPANETVQRARAEAAPVTETPHVRPAALSDGDAMLARVERDSSKVLRPYEPPLQLSTGNKLMFGVGAAGGVVSLVEAADTGHRASGMLALDNPEAARAVLERYGAKGVGGWAGGALAGAAVGWETGPGVIAFVVVGAVAGSELGERVSQHWDNLKILHQTDRAGVKWEFNGRAWQREDRVDSTQDDLNNPTKMPVVASYEMSRELNFMATNKATMLAMGKVEPPRDPFTLLADSGDRHSLERADWKFDAEHGRWQREVVTQYIERGQKITEFEYAKPERAAELSESSLQIMQANVANGPAAIATRYEVVYIQQGWSKFGPMPEAVRTALMDQDRLMASDGNVYERQQDGDWVHRNQFLSDDHAQGTRHLELNASRVLLQAGVMQHAQSLNTIEPRELRSSETMQREEMAYRYGIVGTELKPEWQDAILLATQRTRETHGITGPGLTQLKPANGGEAAADTPIAHLQRGGDGANHIIAITSSEEIRQALEEVRVRQRPEDSMASHAPEQRIAVLTPEQRDVREQATREANRQGLSQDAAQQMATLATIEVRAKRTGPYSPRITAAESADEPETATQVAEASPSQPTPPAPMPVRDAEEREPEAERKDVPPQPVGQAGQNEAKSAPSPEYRAQDAPDAPAVAQVNPPSTQPTGARQQAPEPPADSDVEISVSQQPAVPAEQPISAVPRKAGISDDDTALPVHRDSAAEMSDRPSPTPPSQERTDEAKAVAAAPDQPPPLQAIEAPLVGSADMPHSARAEQEYHSEQTMAPARTFTGGAGRSPGDAAEKREEDRDDVDRREAPHAEVQTVSSDVPLPPVTVRADAREQDDEEKRIDHGRRGQESADSLRAPEQATPETAPRSFDPRHPDHPDHAMYQNAREKVADLYERHGIPMQEDQLERTTAAVLSDARENKMTHVEEVQFTVSRQKPNGEMTVAGNLLVWEGDPKQQSQMPWMKFSATDMQAVDQRDPDRDYARFREETIKEQKSLEAFQKQQEEINKNQDGPLMRIGPRSLNSDANDSSSGDGGGGDG